MVEIHRKMLKDSTYMCFLRILIDFLAWQDKDEKEQSKIVGRNKVTGCPLDPQSPNNPVKGCPITGTNSILDRGNSQFLDYKKFLEKSHNNQMRIFRQGYNFFDSTDDDPYIKVGLNFVSFQNDLSRLHTILTNDQWMGGVTFGGTGNELANMFKIESAGMFFVPPMNDKFPGSEIFEPDNHQ
jgi:deferrochelatase/peroxidase EfeB